jgi:hypothetical protein
MRMSHIEYESFLFFEESPGWAQNNRGKLTFSRNKAFSSIFMVFTIDHNHDYKNVQLEYKLQLQRYQFGCYFLWWHCMSHLSWELPGNSNILIEKCSQNPPPPIRFLCSSHPQVIYSQREFLIFPIIANWLNN